jgi:hypothetical protein
MSQAWDTRHRERLLTAGIVDDDRATCVDSMVVVPLAANASGLFYLSSSARGGGGLRVMTCRRARGRVDRSPGCRQQRITAWNGEECSGSGTPRSALAFR